MAERPEPLGPWRLNRSTWQWERLAFVEWVVKERTRFSGPVKYCGAYKLYGPLVPVRND